MIIRCNATNRDLGEAMIAQTQVRAGHARRAFAHGRKLVAALAVTFLVGSLTASGALAKGSIELSVRLPGTLQGLGAHDQHTVVHGHATVVAPGGWRSMRSTDGGTSGHLRVSLSGACAASIEVSTWIGVLGEPAFSSIESSMDFWYGVFAPVAPRPLPLVAKHVSRERAWALSTPPEPSPDTEPASNSGPPATPVRVSPYFGVDMQRLALPDTWAAVMVGARTTPACVANLPRRASLQAALEGMLKGASFHASIG
jgi:hypothetical protein